MQQLALDHEPALAAPLRPADQQIGPPAAQRGLPVEAAAAVHDPLQVRLQQQLRARLVVLVETLHPVLGVLPEERLERPDQTVHVQAAGLVHVPRRLLRQTDLHRVGQVTRRHFAVDRIGEARRAVLVQGDETQVADIADVLVRPGVLVGPGQNRLDDAPHPFLAELARQLVDVRFPAQDQPLLRLQDVVLLDGARAVAAGLVSEAGVVTQRVHQPRLARGARPDRLQRRLRERLPGLSGVLREQGAHLRLREVAEPQRL